MCNNRKDFFYFIRLIIIFLSFIIHFKKSQSYKKRANKCCKARCKNENKKLSWEMDCRYTFNSILQGFSRKRFDLYQQFGFFLFCFNVFWLFFFELNIFFKFNNNGNKYFTTECLFSAPLYKVPVKMFNRSARTSQKRFVSSEVHLWDARSFFISVCFIWFDFQFKLFIFSNL